MTTVTEWLNTYDMVPQDLIQGRDVFVIGGGPSLRNFDPKILEGRDVIVTNEAFSMIPDAKVLVFVDIGWWQGRKQAVLDTFTGTIIGRGPYSSMYRADKIVNVAFRSGDYWSEDPRQLGGRNSGLAAINAAVLMGARRVFLLGFDMRSVGDRNNYHILHPTSVGRQQHRYLNIFLPEMVKASQRIEALGHIVINCTPDSALTCFPERTLEWVLRTYPRPRPSLKSNN